MMKKWNIYTIRKYINAFIRKYDLPIWECGFNDMIDENLNLRYYPIGEWSNGVASLLLFTSKDKTHNLITYSFMDWIVPAGPLLDAIPHNIKPMLLFVSLWALGAPHLSYKISIDKREWNASIDVLQGKEKVKTLEIMRRGKLVISPADWKKEVDWINAQIFMRNIQ